MKNTNCTQLVSSRSSLIINVTRDLSTDFVFTNNKYYFFFFFFFLKTEKQCLLIFFQYFILNIYYVLS
ncbi:hypothetical protein DEO29_03015 [Buchnera aphidicola (Schizaphis graminum)]|nr:hypothetical protein DEO29_03015 [Buchnera aphidicola (Schizaphis graminum)]